jgi:hypothetical protein
MIRELPRAGRWASGDQHPKQHTRPGAHDGARTTRAGRRVLRQESH